MNNILSPSIHEGMVARHAKPDEDDAVLAGMVAATKAVREACAKAASTAEAVLRNEMKTPAMRHKEARAATFTLLEKSGAAVDAAFTTAKQEIAALQEKLKSPAVDAKNETRCRELRERMFALPPPQRIQVINQAVADDDRLLLAAALDARAWEVGLTPAEQNLVRANWARRHHAAELDRLDRLQKAVTDMQRAGTLATKFVDELTDADLIANATGSERKAAEALAAARG